MHGHGRRNVPGMSTAPNHGVEIKSSSCNIRKPTLLPIGTMTVSTIQGQSILTPLMVLFDTGSMVTLVSQRVLSEHIVSRSLNSFCLYTRLVGQ